METVLLAADTLFEHLMDACVKPEFSRLADNGNPLLLEQLMLGPQKNGLPEEQVFLEDGQQIRLYGTNGCFYGIYGWRAEENRLKPVKMFLSR